MLCLLLSLVLEASSRMSAEALPAFPGAQTVEIGQSVQTLGQEFRFGVAKVAVDGAAVARFFLEQWNRQGLPTIVEQTPARHWVIAAFDLTRGIQKAAVIAPEPTETLIFTAIADLWWEPPPPVLPGETALSLSAVGWSDPGRQSRQVESLFEGDLGQARDQVARALGVAGYAQVQEERGANQILLEHRDRTRTAITLLRRVDRAMTSVTQLLQEASE